MVSIMDDGTARGHYGLEKFHVTFMQQLINVVSPGVFELCTVTDRCSTVTIGNLSVT